MIPLDFSSSFFCTHEGAKELLIDRSRLSLMAWLHAKLQYINSEWYKTENKTRVHIIIINIRELRGWILKYFLKGVFFFLFSFDMFETLWKLVAKPKEISSLSERKKAALECTAVARRTTNKTTWSHLWERGWRIKENLKKICPTMKPSSSSHPAE